MICTLLLIASQSDPGLACLNAWNSRLKEARTLSGTLELNDSGVQKEPYVFKLERPNLALLTGDGMVTASDDKGVVTYVKASNQYFKRRPYRKLPSLGMYAFGMEAVAGEESNFNWVKTTEENGLYHLTMRQKPGAMTLIGDRIALTGPFEMVWTFQRETGDLAGFVLDNPEGKLVGVYKNFAFDRPIPKNTLRFDLPRDATPFEETDLAADYFPVGSKAPEMKFKSTDGREISLTEYVKSRKVTLVNFWFYGCGGCMIEFPHINQLHRRYGTSGFGVIGVNPIDDEKTISAYYSEGKFSFPSLMAKSAQSESDPLYRVQAFPSNFLLGPDMTILDRFVGEDEDRLLDAMEKAGIKLAEESRP